MSDDPRFTGWDHEDPDPMLTIERPMRYRARRRAVRRHMWRDIFGLIVRPDYDATPDWYPDTSKDIPF